jgi:hypothetical protein
MYYLVSFIILLTLIYYSINFTYQQINNIFEYIFGIQYYKKKKKRYKKIKQKNTFNGIKYIILLPILLLLFNYIYNNFIIKKETE